MIQKSFSHIEYVTWDEQGKLFPLTGLPTLSYKEFMAKIYKPMLFWELLFL